MVETTLLAMWYLNSQAEWQMVSLSKQPQEQQVVDTLNGMPVPPNIFTPFLNEWLTEQDGCS